MDEKLAGVSESPISSQVVSIARCLGPSAPRSLNSIHLAPPNLLNSNIVSAYDNYLFIKASEFGFRTMTPGGAIRNLDSLLRGLQSKVVHAAIYGKRDAGGGAGCRAGQVDDRSRHLVRGDQTAVRLASVEGGTFSVRVGGLGQQASNPGGVCGARCYAVNTDAFP